MKHISKSISLLLLFALLLALVPAQAGTASYTEPGNSSLNILNGGTMVTSGDLFCSYNDFDGALHVQRGEEDRVLCYEAGRNLNLCGETLYYTVGSTLKRIALSGGEAETVFVAEEEIGRLYVMGQELRYTAAGKAWSHDLQSGKTVSLSSLTGVMGLIPTAYGNLFLTGEVFSYSLYAEDALILQNVQSCYTDSGYLALSLENENYMIWLADLFTGTYEIEDFCIHGEVTTAALFEEAAEHACSVCEEAAEACAILATEGEEEAAVIPEEEEPLIPTVSQGQENMVKRARQLHEIAWTPIYDRTQWGYRGTFSAGVTVTGLPYGQPVNNQGYVGWNISLDEFLDAVNDSTSKFYSGYSTYNKIAPYYSCDCSAFVSYAWGLGSRMTTYAYASVAELVSEQSIYAIQVGDALNNAASHIVFVSAVRYDAEGNITSIDIMEQTPVKTKYTRYGEGGTKTLAALQSYYFGGGYVLYRKADRDAVTYTHSCAVPIDGDYCASCRAAAPIAKTTAVIGSKSVTLSHSDASAVIYYTLDGTQPTLYSKRYTGETLTFNSDGQIRAIAVTSTFSSSRELKYTVTIPPVATPTATVASGLNAGNLVQSGSTIKLSTTTANATLYYTTDGSQPTTASAKYTAPITITANTTLRVMGLAPGCKQSETASFSYQIGAVYTVNATAGTGGSISPSGSASVIQTGSKTFTIQAKSGYAIDTVTVDGVSVGEVSSYTFSNMSGNHTISASFKVVATHPFTDVSSDAWFHSAVNYAYQVGLFNGTSATTFSPDVAMTRGMFVTVLGRMAGVDSALTAGTGIITGSDVNFRSGPSTDTQSQGLLSKYKAVQILGTEGQWVQISVGGKTGYVRGDFVKTYTNTYTDVSAEAYYRPYVEWATLSGIASGTGSTTFSPDTPITREDMCVYFYNYISRYGIKIGSTVAKTTFVDEASIHSSALTAVYALQQAGVISGIGNNTFSPAGSATRAMVAQIFMNLANAIG